MSHVAVMQASVSAPAAATVNVTPAGAAAAAGLRCSRGLRTTARERNCCANRLRGGRPGAACPAPLRATRRNAR